MPLYILIGVIVLLFIRIVVIPAWNRYQAEKRKEFMDTLQPQFDLAMKETELINSKEIPTDEDIKIYYKMYLKKWELDHDDEWETEIVKPMDFEEWEKIAKKVDNELEIGGYRFIIGKTMDMFIGFPPNMSMMRYRDYRSMVESEEENDN